MTSAIGRALLCLTVLFLAACGGGDDAVSEHGMAASTSVHAPAPVPYTTSQVISGEPVVVAYWTFTSTPVAQLVQQYAITLKVRAAAGALGRLTTADVRFEFYADGVALSQYATDSKGHVFRTGDHELDVAVTVGTTITPAAIGPGPTHAFAIKTTVVLVDLDAEVSGDAALHVVTAQTERW